MPESSHIESPLILTLDVGTSSVRAIAFDSLARAVPGVSARIAHSVRTLPDGGAEFDAAELFERCAEVIDGAHRQAAQLALPVVAVAVDTFVGNLLAVDARGDPLSPIITYADTRSAAALENLRQQIDDASTYQRAGVPLHTAFWPSQLMWLRTSRPETFRAARRWLTFGDYLMARIFGHHACSLSVASWTGLLNRHTLQWDGDLLSVLGVDAGLLSPLVDTNVYFTSLDSTYAARWPLLKDARWYSAMADGAAANIGSGCHSPARAALTIGTTSAIRTVMHAPPQQVPRGLWCYRVDGRRPLLGGALGEGGNIRAWLMDLLGLSRWPEDELAALLPDAHGLTFLPLLAGERSPGWRADARGAVTGLSLATRPVQMLRASIEAVAYRIGFVWRLLEPAVPEVEEIVGSGGGLESSPLWMQIISDVLNRPLAASAEPEATSRGAALLALEAMGVLAVPDAEFRLDRRFEPIQANHEIYLKAMARQHALYETLFSQPPGG